MASPLQLYLIEKSSIVQLSVISLVLCWMLFKVVYNLYFHPLSRFPGPKLNALSPLPAIYSMITGRLPLQNKTLHDKYGPVIRVSPNELDFDSAQAWQDIYGHRPGMANMHKDPIHVGSVAPFGGMTSLTMADDETHARQRRALSVGFGQSALSEQEDVVQHHVGKLITALASKADLNSTFNLVNWLNFTTFDIIGDLTFGEPFGCLDTGKFDEWLSAIYETVRGGAYEQATRRFASPGSLSQKFLRFFIPSRNHLARSQHLTKSREKCLTRLARPDVGKRDFIWYTTEQRRKGLLSEGELIVNSAMFIVAGSETSAGLLAGLFARLIWHPDIHRKLVDELRTKFQSESEMTNDSLSTLVYFNACIEEALRIHPPLPTGLLRTVPKGGASIDGHFVAEGTSVAVSSWAATHSQNNFKDPDAFIPERWIDQSYSTDKKKASQPFSLGPRGCIGKHIGYMEIRIILARLLWSFDLISVDGAWQWDPSGDMRHMKAYMTWDKPNLDMVARKARRDGDFGSSAKV